MANTVENDGIFIEVSQMDSDYDVGAPVPVHSIKLIPGAADDIVVIKSFSVTGVEGCKLHSSDGEPRYELFNGIYWRPVIDYSECTLSAGHRIIITMDTRKESKIYRKIA
jgi:hypothetical protein